MKYGRVLYNVYTVDRAKGQHHQGRSGSNCKKTASKFRTDLVRQEDTGL